MIFADRITAAEKLAEALSAYQDKNPLVLAIPRGAVPMAKVIAEELNGEMDVVLVRKLRAPGNPEFAIGSVDESGWVYLTEYAEQAGADQDYINREVSVQLETIRQRRAQYNPMHPPVDPAGRIVIVIDDGLATGSTMIACTACITQQETGRIDLYRACSAAGDIEEIRRKSGSYCLLVIASQFLCGRAVLQGISASDR